jgi:hypothetical protein
MSDNPSSLSHSFMTVFLDDRRLGAGSLAEAAVTAWRARQNAPAAVLLAFERRTGRVVDLDLRGSEADVAARHAPQPQTPDDAETSPARRGRPKLGVTAREVTLLPRHWEWLADQPGGASATLRRLVEAARKADAGASDERARRDAAYRFMSTMAGDRPGFENAARALYAGDNQAMSGLMQGWPGDIAAEINAILSGD